MHDTRSQHRGLAMGLVRAEREGPAVAAAERDPMVDPGERDSCCSRRRSAGCCPAHDAWLGRWPEPAALAAATPADAVRQWDRLGYPRRAVRLHASRRAHHRPARRPGAASVDELHGLPGVGPYTAAAVASFAFGAAPCSPGHQRSPGTGQAGHRREPGEAPARRPRELRLAESLLPHGRQAGGPLVGGRDGTRRPDLHGRAAALR